MPRYLKILIGLLSGFAFLLVVAIVIITTMSWNWTKPWTSRQLSELTHRQVQIDGKLSVDWQRQTELNGWKGWIPWPTIRAERVTVGNPAWATLGPVMLQADDVHARVNLFALARHELRLADLQIQGGHLIVERRKDGVSNLAFSSHDAEPQKSDWTVAVDRLRLVDASVRVLDATHQLDVTVHGKTSDTVSDAGYGTQWTADGRFHDVDVKGEGRLGQVLALHSGDDAFPVKAVISVGSTRMAIEGRVTRPHDIAAIEVDLEVSGPTMADLYPLLGLVLPETPPYQITGHLRASLEGQHDVWTYENFSGTVGKSDLNGTLIYRVQPPRPVLSGSVESTLLRLKDLGPLIGASAPRDVPINAGSESAQATGKKEERLTAEEPMPSGDKVLPIAKADTHVWKTMDADISFAGKRIVSNHDLPLDDVKGHVTLVDGILKLEPLEFGVAGGTLNSTIVFDGSDDVIHSQLDAQARGLRLDQLFPAVKSMDAALGTMHGDVHLSGRGNSVSEFLKHANGDLRAAVSKGTVSKLLLEAAGLNIANIVFVKIFGDKQVVLQCLVMDFRVNNGLMSTRTFILETDDAVVTVDGQINLASETLKLAIHPENKSLRILTLRSPLYVRGTFKDPDVGIQEESVAARAAAAIALGVIGTPLAALLPLLNLGTDDTTTCVTVRSHAKGKANASVDQKKRLKGSVSGVEPIPAIEP